MAEIHISVSEVILADDNSLAFWLAERLLDHGLGWTGDAYDS
jgi:hypothetical protein